MANRDCRPCIFCGDKRTCYVCELETEIARLTAELKSATAALAPLDAVVHELEIEDEAIEPVEAVRALKAELAASQERTATVIPGCMKCAKCGFGLVRTTLYVGNGTAGPGNNETEPCPNGCGPLWPETWEARARDMQRVTEEALDRERVLRDAVKGGIDLAEFWIERGREVNMSEERYSTWLSLGYHSNSLQKMRAALKKL